MAKNRTSMIAGQWRVITQPRLWLPIEGGCALSSRVEDERGERRPHGHGLCRLTPDARARCSPSRDARLFAPPHGAQIAAPLWWGLLKMRLPNNDRGPDANACWTPSGHGDHAECWQCARPWCDHGGCTHSRCARCNANSRFAAKRLVNASLESGHASPQIARCNHASRSIGPKYAD